MGIILLLSCVGVLCEYSVCSLCLSKFYCYLVGLDYIYDDNFFMSLDSVYYTLRYLLIHK